MAQLIIPTPLRKFTDGQGIFTEEAATVKDLLAALASQHPGLKPHLFEDSGSLQSTDEVSIIPAIAGGV
jgi:hypothetical protein